MCLLDIWYTNDKSEIPLGGDLWRFACRLLVSAVADLSRSEKGCNGLWFAFSLHRSHSFWMRGYRKVTSVEA